VRPVTRARGKNGDITRTFEEPRRVMPVDVADVITDVLSDEHARASSFGERSVLDLPFAVAAKTGTSKGFRDNWTAGYTRDVTVAVWVGNMDGSPMRGTSGITGAGPLFRAVMLAAMASRRSPAADALTAHGDDLVRVDVCPLSGRKAGPACHHRIEERMPRARAAALDTCTMHELVSIDRRTGLRAGDSCPAELVETRSFEVFDGAYAQWAKTAGRSLAPDAWSPLCAGHGAPPASIASRVSVRYPHDGARFVVDPGRPLAVQTIAVSIDVPREMPAASIVTLVVDGRRMGSSEANAAIQWPLARGNHEISAEFPGVGASEPVRIAVQ
jgi:penicillin-binding protein 1C